MIDYARITIIAGSGGNGAGSFMHIKGKRRGKADGGDGGRGGDVYLEATRDLNTLEPFRFVKEYKAKNGTHGLSRKRKGADGEELVIKVPVGTVARIGKLSESESQQVSISEDQNVRVSDKPKNRVTESSEFSGIDYDLVEDRQRVLVARGGEGGRGNVHLKDEFSRRPKVGEKGQEGEEVEMTLELKLIADVGLIGLPNAGKSTLLAALTAATPEIADYPFTTLEPNLGVLTLNAHAKGQAFAQSTSTLRPGLSMANHLVIADIPGLIEGASEGKGLGHLFLRHIERTKILVHMIDISSTDDVWKTYQAVRMELKNYSKELAKKKEIIVLNKIDLVEKQTVDSAVQLFKSKRKKVVAISAKTTLGLAELLKELP